MIGQQISALPAWVQNWSQVGGLLTIKDANGDGILQLSEFIINQDIIVLSMPEIAGLPYVISGLVAAGGLAAALSTADGLLLAIANALSHDVYYKMIDPKASTMRRLVVARVLLVVVAIIAAAVAGTRPAGIIQMVAWAFSLAAAGLFAPLVLGIWWKRTTRGGRDRRHDRRLRRLPVLPRRHALFRHAAVVRHPQHLERAVRPAAGVPGDLGREPDDRAAVEGDAGLRRFDPRAQGRPRLGRAARTHE